MSTRDVRATKSEALRSNIDSAIELARSRFDEKVKEASQAGRAPGFVERRIASLANDITAQQHAKLRGAENRNRFADLEQGIETGYALVGDIYAALVSIKADVRNLARLELMDSGGSFLAYASTKTLLGIEGTTARIMQLATHVGLPLDCGLSTEIRDLLVRYGDTFYVRIDEATAQYEVGEETVMLVSHHYGDSSG